MYAVPLAIVGLLVGAAGWLWVGFLRFRTRVFAYLSGCPDIRWSEKTPTTVACAVLGYPLEADLLTTYIYQRRTRMDETRLLQDFVHELRSQVPPVPVPPFTQVRELIFPSLKRTERVIPAAGYRPENHVVQTALDLDVRVIYVIDSFRGLLFITEGMMIEWKIERDVLHTLALANLRRRTQHMLDELGGRRTEYVALDGYDATRILIADLIVPDMIDQPVIAIPHEHACLIGRLHDAPILAARAASEYQRARVPLTPRLYRPTPAGPVPFTGASVGSSPKVRDRTDRVETRIPQISLQRRCIGERSVESDRWH